MKVHLESTDRVVEVNGAVEARVWQGTTESGIEVTALITRVSICLDTADQAAFEAELDARPPVPLRIHRDAWPHRLVL